MDLPRLDLHHSPIRHAHCCLSISQTLLEILLTVFVHHGNSQRAGEEVVLSVGSGTGLLEALLQDHIDRHRPVGSANPLTIEGVEVEQSGSAAPSVNKYLAEQHMNMVRKTGDVSPRLLASNTTCVIFVYPRQTSLVLSYVETLSSSRSLVVSVVWLGPIADWGDFRPCFEPLLGCSIPGFRQNMIVGQDSGLDDYEMMVSWTRVD